MAGSTRDELGRHGEDVAAQYLAERGMVVLSRNWRCREGELDLVATDRKRLVLASHRWQHMSTSASRRTRRVRSWASRASVRTA